MKFSELSYQRPDLKTLRRDLTAVLDRFQTAPDYDTAESAYLEMDRVFGRYMTQQVIANIRRDIDTRDPFYEGLVQPGGTGATAPAQGLGPGHPGQPLPQPAGEDLWDDFLFEQ